MILQKIETLASSLADLCFALYPQKTPSLEAIAKTKIVAHRGECNFGAKENTMPAFETAKQYGAWGIEFDIRFSKDNEPIIHHDRGLQRVFGIDKNIPQHNWKDLKKFCPQLIHLQDIIQKFGTSLHYMIEIKDHIFPNPQQQFAKLQSALKDLKAIEHYHFLALNPQTLHQLNFVQSEALVLVSLINAKAMSKIALAKNFGAHAGSYILIHKKMRERHQAQGQKIGPGFINSKNALFREINLASDWIFTNDTAKLRKIIQSCLEKN